MFETYGEIYRALGPTAYLGLYAASACAWAALAMRRARDG